MDLYLHGDVGLSRFDEYVSLWMDFEYNQKMPKKMRPLRAYLGFTPEEYQRWIDDPSCLAKILLDRKTAVQEPDIHEPGWIGIPGQGFMGGGFI